MVALHKGYRGRLDALVAPDRPFTVRLAVDGPGPCQAACLGLDPFNRLAGGAWVVYGEQRISPGGGLTMEPTPDGGIFNVDLGRLPSRVGKLDFCVSAAVPEGLGRFRRITATIAQSFAAQAIELDLEGLEGALSVQVVRIHLKEGWRLFVIGHGHPGDLGALAGSLQGGAAGYGRAPWAAPPGLDVGPAPAPGGGPSEANPWLKGSLYSLDSLLGSEAAPAWLKESLAGLGAAPVAPAADGPEEPPAGRPGPPKPLFQAWTRLATEAPELEPLARPLALALGELALPAGKSKSALMIDQSPSMWTKLSGNMARELLKRLILLGAVLDAGESLDAWLARYAKTPPLNVRNYNAVMAKSGLGPQAQGHRGRMRLFGGLSGDDVDAIRREYGRKPRWPVYVMMVTDGPAKGRFFDKLEAVSGYPYFFQVIGLGPGDYGPLADFGQAPGEGPPGRGFALVDSFRKGDEAGFFHRMLAKYQLWRRSLGRAGD